jgi:hypothetical protein
MTYVTSQKLVLFVLTLQSTCTAGKMMEEAKSVSPRLTTEAMAIHLVGGVEQRKNPTYSQAHR